MEGAEGGSVHGRGPARTLLFAGIAAGGASWTPLAASAMPTLPRAAPSPFVMADLGFTPQFPETHGAARSGAPRHGQRLRRLLGRRGRSARLARSERRRRAGGPRARRAAARRRCRAGRQPQLHGPGRVRQGLHGRGFNDSRGGDSTKSSNRRTSFRLSLIPPVPRRCSCPPAFVVAGFAPRPPSDSRAGLLQAAVVRRTATAHEACLGVEGERRWCVSLISRAPRT
jgi:hypothetical protein